MTDGDCLIPRNELGVPILVTRTEEPNYRHQAYVSPLPIRAHKYSGKLFGVPESNFVRLFSAMRG